MNNDPVIIALQQYGITGFMVVITAMGYGWLVKKMFNFFSIQSDQFRTMMERRDDQMMSMAKDFTIAVGQMQTADLKLANAIDGLSDRIENTNNDHKAEHAQILEFCRDRHYKN